MYPEAVALLDLLFSVEVKMGKKVRDWLSQNRWPGLKVLGLLAVGGLILLFYHGLYLLAGEQPQVWQAYATMVLVIITALYVLETHRVVQTAKQQIELQTKLAIQQRKLRQWELLAETEILHAISMNIRDMNGREREEELRTGTVTFTTREYEAARYWLPYFPPQVRERLRAVFQRTIDFDVRRRAPGANSTPWGAWETEARGIIGEFRALEGWLHNEYMDMTHSETQET